MPERSALTDRSVYEEDSCGNEDPVPTASQPDYWNSFFGNGPPAESPTDIIVPNSLPLPCPVAPSAGEVHRALLDRRKRLQAGKEPHPVSVLRLGQPPNGNSATEASPTASASQLSDAAFVFSNAERSSSGTGADPDPAAPEAEGGEPPLGLGCLVQPGQDSLIALQERRKLRSASRQQLQQQQQQQQQQPPSRGGGGGAGRLVAGLTSSSHSFTFGQGSRPSLGPLRSGPPGMAATGAVACPPSPNTAQPASPAGSRPSPRPQPWPKLRSQPSFTTARSASQITQLPVGLEDYADIGGAGAEWAVPVTGTDNGDEDAAAVFAEAPDLPPSHGPTGLSPMASRRWAPAADAPLPPAPASGGHGAASGLRSALSTALNSSFTSASRPSFSQLTETQVHATAAAEWTASFPGPAAGPTAAVPMRRQGTAGGSRQSAAPTTPPAAGEGAATMPAQDAAAGGARVSNGGGGGRVPSLTAGSWTSTGRGSSFTSKFNSFRQRLCDVAARRPAAGPERGPHAPGPGGLDPGGPRAAAAALGGGEAAAASAAGRPFPGRTPGAFNSWDGRTALGGAEGWSLVVQPSGSFTSRAPLPFTATAPARAGAPPSPHSPQPPPCAPPPLRGPARGAAWRAASFDSPLRTHPSGLPMLAGPSRLSADVPAKARHSTDPQLGVGPGMGFSPPQGVGPGPGLGFPQASTPQASMAAAPLSADGPRHLHVANSFTSQRRQPDAARVTTPQGLLAPDDGL